MVKCANESFLKTFGGFINIDIDDKIDDEMLVTGFCSIFINFLGYTTTDEDREVRAEKWRRLSQKSVLIDTQEKIEKVSSNTANALEEGMAARNVNRRRRRKKRFKKYKILAMSFLIIRLSI